MPDLQTFINIVVALFSSIGGWFMRTMWQAQKEMASDLAKLREEIPKEYVTKHDFKDSIESIHSKLDRIEDKMDKFLFK
jgi:hypothetical protein